jgi:transposase
MDGSIAFSASQRQSLCHLIQRGPDRAQARRAHVLYLLGEGKSVRFIADVLLCSFDLIAQVRRDFRRRGFDAALGLDTGPVRRVPIWWTRLLRWALEKTPRDFGFARSRWTCATLALNLRRELGLRLGRESVRRILRDLGFVWRRPRPVVGPTDPDHKPKMKAIRHLLAHLCSWEVAVFQDEVQLDLNPKIGRQWMLCGHQSEVVTPGDNVQRHLAVSQVVGSGKLIVSEATQRRNSDQFLAHLEDLCRRLRRYRVIHVICDNAVFHKSKKVRDWVAKRGGRIVLHYLPTRAPKENPVELVFWRLHEAITRNHRCTTIDELVQQANAWMENPQIASTMSENYTLAA